MLGCLIEFKIMWTRSQCNNLKSSDWSELVVKLSIENAVWFSRWWPAQKIYSLFFFTCCGDQNGHSLEHCAHKSQIKDLFTSELAFKRNCMLRGETYVTVLITLSTFSMDILITALCTFCIALDADQNDSLDGLLLNSHFLCLPINQTGSASCFLPRVVILYQRSHRFVWQLRDKSNLNVKWQKSVTQFRAWKPL